MLIQKLKEVPDTWLICLTILFFPLAVGLGVKIVNTDFISFIHGNTQIELGEVVEESDRIIAELKAQNQALSIANQKAQEAAKNKKVKLPELKVVEKAVEESEKLTVELQDNNQTLQTLTENE